MPRVGEYRPASPGLFWRHFARLRAKGLTEDFAYDVATLLWWGDHYGLPPPPIVSGRRSRASQERLWAAFLRGDHPGPVARPGTSLHERGEAVDLGRTGFRWIYGAWAHLVGIKWGGDFSKPDPPHFQRAA